MTENELKNRAQRLTTKLNGLGFTKNGKPMVIDQAYELLAAEEGYRNQHVLRTKLGTELVPSPLSVPVTRESEQVAECAWISVVNKMGWNDSSEVIHLEGFIRERGLMGELAKYAERVAAEEDGSSDLLDDPIVDASAEAAVEPTSESMIAFLETLGYEMKESDFNNPFWEFGDVGSEDFVNEAQAWDDAWLDAMTTACEALGIPIQDWPALQVAAQRKALEQFNRRTLFGMTGLLLRCGFEFTGVSRGQYTWAHADDDFPRAPSNSLTRAVAEAWAFAKGKIGLAEAVYSATPFEALLVLVEAALTGRVEGEQSVGQPEASDASRKAVADEAYAAFDFGAEVVGDSGWAWTAGSRVFRRPVFLAVEGSDSKKVVFTVTVNDVGCETAVTEGDL